MRRDIEIYELHGNVETRIKKVLDLGLDGIVLATAGLERVGETNRISQIFSIDEVIPAIGQGTIAVEAREDDEDTLRILSIIDDKTARIASECERAFARKLGGDCYVPLGAYAEPSSESLRVTGMIASPDGTDFLKQSLMGNASAPQKLGEELADQVLQLGGRKILEAAV